MDESPGDGEDDESTGDEIDDVVGWDDSAGVYVGLDALTATGELVSGAFVAGVGAGVLDDVMGIDEFNCATEVDKLDVVEELDGTDVFARDIVLDVPGALPYGEFEPGAAGGT